MSTLLERRKIEAEFAQVLYEEIVLELGEEKSLDILSSVARKLARKMGNILAERDGETNIRSFAKILSLWQEDGALEIEHKELSDHALSFDVTRCRYAEMYEEIGASYLGSALSCNRDGSLCEGYDHRIKMKREETIMTGHSRCKFRFVLDLEE